MKKIINKVLLFTMCASCSLLFTGCAQILSQSAKAGSVAVEEAEKAVEDAVQNGVNEVVSDIDLDKEDVQQALDELKAFTEEFTHEPKEWENSALLTSYNWKGTDGSLLVFEENGTFRYYQSADDLTNNYFEGTYLFFIGGEATTYMTTTLSDYNVTGEELATLFTNNEEYYEANFMVYVLNNEVCMINGENTVENPYQNPYMGFCLEQDGTIYLDVANMNTANYSLYEAVAK